MKTLGLRLAFAVAFGRARFVRGWLCVYFLCCFEEHLMTRLELITLHALELAEMIGGQNRAGTLTIAADGEELAEFDLEDVCLVVKLEEPIDDEDEPATLPLR